MILTIVILAVILCVTVYIIWNLSRKIAVLEKYTSEFLTDLMHLRSRISQANDIINGADLRGAFASDDEVGSAFTIIKEAINGILDESTIDDTQQNNGKS